MTLATLAFTQVSDSTPYAPLTAALVVRGMGLGAELAAAFGSTFWWAVALAALAFVPALFLPRRPVPAARRQVPAPEPAGAARQTAPAAADT